jgi:hypothetical protein
MHDGAVVRPNQHVHVLVRVLEAPDDLGCSVSVIQTFLECHPRMLKHFGLQATGGPNPVCREITMTPHVLQQDTASHNAMI